MRFHQARNKITCALILPFFIKPFYIFTEMNDNRLVICKQGFHKTGAVILCSRFLRKMCFSQKSSKRSFCIMTNGANTFCNVINQLLQLFILFFKKAVDGQKIWSFYIPMRSSGFDVQYIFVCE